MNSKHIKAFTLSEVLIALVIIGVIAAITVPVVYANYVKEALKTGYTKAYSDLNNFSRKFYADYGISFSEYASEHTYEQNYAALKKYIYSAYNSSINQGMVANEDYEYYYKGMNGSEAFPVCDDIGLYVSAGGRFYGMNNPPPSDVNGPIICVDTNGAKGPNRYGYDFFIFAATLDGRVIPMGMEDENNTTETSLGYTFFVSGSQYCSKTSSSNGNNTSGLTCSYYALIDKSPKNSAKSYWKDFI